jgi:hypothetical protein
MKKFSIRIFVALAVIFAIASSFASATDGEYKWHEFLGFYSGLQGDFSATELDASYVTNPLCGSTTDSEICAGKFRYVDPTHPIEQDNDNFEFAYIEED